MTIQSVAFIFAFIITFSETARILAVFPTPSISHQVVFRPLTQELARRGHEVVIITTDPVLKKGETLPNFREIDVHDMSYKKWEEFYKVTSKGNNDMITQMREAFTSLNTVFEMQLRTPEVQKLMIEEKFDLLFLEACVKPALIFSHVFKAPVIQISSLGFLNYNVNTIGAAWHPLLYPNILSQRLHHLTNWEKIVALYDFYKIEAIMETVEEEENLMVKRVFGPNVPTISELKNNVDMMFLNVHPIWESNRPVPSSVVYMWGIHERIKKELPKDLKNYLNSSKNGVIYMSLGTNVKPSLLPPEKVKLFVKVFSGLPYDVLWKWDKDELPGKSKNIQISKWLPQSDLLRHPKIKVFITQGGLQSTEEAIDAGVPLIGIPMLGDQWYNVETYEYHKIGVKLDMNTLEEEQLNNAIQTVIGDKSYRSNVKRLGGLMRDEPMRPLDRAVWWTEYVLRHGGAKHLRAPAANISWSQYLEFELVLTIFFTIVISITGTLCVICYIWRICNTSKMNQKVKKS